MQIIINWIDLAIANPSRTLGIIAACIYAVLMTLVGKGILTPDFVQNVQNLGAFVAILITAFFPTWGPFTRAAAARAK